MVLSVNSNILQNWQLFMRSIHKTKQHRDNKSLITTYANQE